MEAFSRLEPAAAASDEPRYSLSKYTSPEALRKDFVPYKDDKGRFYMVEQEGQGLEAAFWFLGIVVHLDTLPICCATKRGMKSEYPICNYNTCRFLTRPTRLKCNPQKKLQVVHAWGTNVPAFHYVQRSFSAVAVFFQTRLSPARVDPVFQTMFGSLPTIHLAYCVFSKVTSLDAEGGPVDVLPSRDCHGYLKACELEFVHMLANQVGYYDDTQKPSQAEAVGSTLETL